MRVEPYAGLAHVHVHGDAFQETGNAGLRGESSGDDVTFSTLGMRLRQPFMLGNRSANVDAGIGWQHAFGDTAPDVTQSYVGGSDFTVEAVPVNQDAIRLETGLSVDLSATSSVSLSYRGDLADSARDQSVNARLAFAF